MKFAKPALAYEAQLDRLIQRGMVINDRQRALHYLQHVNYYRLCAYWLPFEADHASHRFRAGTELDAVLNLYIFDRELRLLVLDAIERIEVSVRAQWAHQMAQAHSPHCHLERDLFKPGWNYEKHRDAWAYEIRRSRETFIRHFSHTYDEALPPLWAAVEVLTFGQLSQWYANTRHSKDRNRIARQFGMDEKIFTSFLHHLTPVRNLCAHHARLWNRELTLLAILPKFPAPLAQSLNHNNKRRVYNSLAILLYLMNLVNPQHHWHFRLVALINKHGINTAEMGFPADWHKLPMWKAAAKK